MHLRDRIEARMTRNVQNDVQQLANTVLLFPTVNLENWNFCADIY